MPAADGSMDSSFSGVVPFVLERQGQGANGSSYMAKKINQLQVRRDACAMANLT
jgi:hypothetical protein